MSVSIYMGMYMLVLLVRGQIGIIFSYQFLNHQVSGWCTSLSKLNVRNQNTKKSTVQNKHFLTCTMSL